MSEHILSIRNWIKFGWIIQAFFPIFSNIYKGMTSKLWFSQNQGKITVLFHTSILQSCQLCRERNNVPCSSDRQWHMFGLLSARRKRERERAHKQRAIAYGDGAKNQQKKRKKSQKQVNREWEGRRRREEGGKEWEWRGEERERERWWVLADGDGGHSKGKTFLQSKGMRRMWIYMGNCGI